MAPDGARLRDSGVSPVRLSDLQVGVQGDLQGLCKDGGLTDRSETCETTRVERAEAPAMPTNPRDLDRAVRRERHERTAERDAWCHAQAGVAFVGASSDLDTDVAAWLVTDDATRPYREVPPSEQEAAELDAARVDQVLDGRAPTTDAQDGRTRDPVRARAQRAADQTRDPRVADVARRSRQLGLDETQPMGRDDRRPPGREPTSAALEGPLVVAFQGNARVWIARRLVAPRWIWRSLGWCAGAGGC
jgi:hypothetical protein